MPRATPDDKKKNKLLQCKKCDTRFTTQWDLNRHFDRKHLGIQFFCDKCGQGFGRSYRRDHHFQRCGQPQNFCTTCCVDFNSAYELNVHQTAEHTLFKYACKLCDRPYASFQALRIHARTCGVPSMAVTKSIKTTLKYKVVNDQLIKIDNTNTSTSTPKPDEDARVKIWDSVNTVPFISTTDALLIAGSSLPSGTWQKASSPTPQVKPRETTAPLDPFVILNMKVEMRESRTAPATVTSHDSLPNSASMDGNGSDPPPTTSLGLATSIDDIWGDSYPDLLLGVAGHQDVNQLRAHETQEELDDLEVFLNNMLGDKPTSPTLVIQDTMQDDPQQSTSGTTSSTPPPSTPMSPTMINLPSLPLPGKPVKPDGTPSQTPMLLWEILREVAISNSMMTRAEDVSNLDRTLSSVHRRLRRANEELLIKNHCQINFT